MGVLESEIHDMAVDSASKMMDGEKLTDIRRPFIAGIIEKRRCKNYPGR